ncbi:MAG: phosphoadenylyl-sulfate reductase [Bacteroidales bacterium]|nr:phosphoadenylyl-sulfate reductase [Bacteroidales bacterium]
MNQLLNRELARELNQHTQSWNILDTLKYLAEKFRRQITFSTSFSYEDQVISDIIFTHNLPITIFTLDTGRLFEETYKVHSRTLAKYDKLIKVYAPDHAKVEKLVTQQGPFSFYESVEQRKECCHIRKVEPLNRALKNMACWITGVRGSQSESRQNWSKFEYDDSHQLIKYNPLINWTLEETIAYIKTNHVPYNILHDRGYPSIGCAPCTRPVKEGEDIRAGRWWWENNTSRECGIHSND